MRFILLPIFVILIHSNILVNRCVCVYYNVLGLRNKNRIERVQTKMFIITLTRAFIMGPKNNFKTRYSYLGIKTMKISEISYKEIQKRILTPHKRSHPDDLCANNKHIIPT